MSSIRSLGKRVEVYSFFILMLLYGCVSHHPDDLGLASIEVVDARETVELTRRSSATASDYSTYMLMLAKTKSGKPINEDDIAPYFELHDQQEEISEPDKNDLLLKVDLTSKTNLARYMNDKGYRVSNVPYLCSDPHEPVLLGRGGLYWRGLDISVPANYELRKEDDGLYRYYVFIKVASNSRSREVYGTDNDATVYSGFDLEENPEDVCIQLKGGALGFGSKSNVVELSAHEIESTLYK